MINHLKIIKTDITEAFRHRELWMALGWRDVLTKYRRSKLGSSWIVLSMAIVAFVMGSLYSVIMNRPPSEYIPYLTVGFIAWNLLSSLISEGAQVFVANSAAIKETSLPPTVYTLRLIWRNIIIFAHNFVVYILVLLAFQHPLPPTVLFAIPAIFLILLNGMWVSLLFGLINLRYRDFSHMITTSMRLIFFVTPIIWYAELATGPREALITMNPFYYFIEILRAPLLGAPATTNIWLVVAFITLLGWGITVPVYARHRRQLAFWV